MSFFAMKHDFPKLMLWPMGIWLKFMYLMRIEVSFSAIVGYMFQVVYGYFSVSYV